MENLCVFVREGSRRNETARLAQDVDQRQRAYFLWREAGCPAEGAKFWAEAVQEVALSDRPAPDIAAVLTVISRRGEENRQRERANLWYLDLAGAVLRGANLRAAHFERADLRYAHFEWAALTDAHLEGAFLVGGAFRPGLPQRRASRRSVPRRSLPRRRNGPACGAACRRNWRRRYARSSWAAPGALAARSGTAGRSGISVDYGKSWPVLAKCGHSGLPHRPPWRRERLADRSQTGLRGIPALLVGSRIGCGEGETVGHRTMSIGPAHSRTRQVALLAVMLCACGE